MRRRVGRCRGHVVKGSMEGGAWVKGSMEGGAWVKGSKEGAHISESRTYIRFICGWVSAPRAKM